jgi:hypothetical protein
MSQQRIKIQLAPEATWMQKGFYEASQCFRCSRKIDHIHKNHMVTILCSDPCLKTDNNQTE